MESAKIQGLSNTFTKGFAAGINSVVSILEASLTKNLHPDFAMDRVIRSVFEEQIKSLKEYQQAYQEQFNTKFTEQKQ